MKAWLGFVAGVASLATFGCATFPRNEPGVGLGKISVGSPTYETNDRLLNERSEQIDWLTKQREALRGATYGVTGSTVLTSSSVTRAQANLSLDPTYGLDGLGQTRQAQALQSATSNEGAIAELQAKALADIKSRRDSGAITPKQAIEECTALGLTCGANATPTAVSPKAAPGPAVAPVAATMDAISAPTSNTTLAPLDQFQRRAFAASVISDQIRALQRDDGFDLAGNTLYRLNFDVTIEPEADASAWAIVRVHLKNPSVIPDADLAVLLDAASQAYTRTLVETTESRYRRMLGKLKGECWDQEFSDKVSKSLRALPRQWRASSKQAKVSEVSVFRRAFLCASDDIGSNTRRAMERGLSTWSPAEPQAPAELKGSQYGRIYMEQLLTQRQLVGESAEDFEARQQTLGLWALWLGEVFDIGTQADFLDSPISCFRDLVVAGDGNGRQQAFPYILKPRGVSSPAVRCKGVVHTDQGFAAALKKNVRASVYAVTPAEAVQDLSEVSANKKSTELLAGLSAIAGNVGVNAAIQNAKSNTAQFETIRHQPLIVGFTDAGSSCKADRTCGQEVVFGWIFGPEFVLSEDGKSTMFRHRFSQKTVSAEVSLPGWLDSLAVDIETCWRRETGVDINCDSTRSSYAIPLPSLPLDALRTVDTFTKRQPRVEQYQYLDVAEGSSADVMISGSDLWRSAQVHIGSQAANVVTVLQNGGGLVAHFDTVNNTAGMQRDTKKRVSLTVHTSEGSVVAGAVRIYGKDEKFPPADEPGEGAKPDKGDVSSNKKAKSKGPAKGSAAPASSAASAASGAA